MEFDLSNPSMNDTINGGDMIFENVFPGVAGFENTQFIISPNRSVESEKWGLYPVFWSTDNITKFTMQLVKDGNVLSIPELSATFVDIDGSGYDQEVTTVCNHAGYSVSTNSTLHVEELGGGCTRFSNTITSASSPSGWVLDSHQVRHAAEVQFTNTGTIELVWDASWGRKMCFVMKPAVSCFEAR